MERIRKTSEAQIRAGQKYDSKTAYKIGIKLNKKTDADLIDHIEHYAGLDGGKQGYIKRLIREDIERSKTVNTTE